MKYISFMEKPIAHFLSLHPVIISIPPGIEEELEIMNLYAEKLDFPDYFGRNWDALFDCLRDLDWLQEKDLVFLHQDIPFKSCEKEMRIYLRILYKTAAHWERYDEHSIEIFFPSQFEKQVTRLLEKEPGLDIL